MIAIRGEYIFERFENDRLLEEPLKLNTHRVPIGLNLFHPSGLSASLTATYYNQDGRFPRLGGVQRGESDFWTVDASINYRLPKRYGFLTMGAANLFDRRFKYFETDRDNLRIQPDRVLFVRVTLALP
jgi:outer membrane receptor protein involved in Fe transport